MTLNFEIDDETGELLDRLAKDGHRSRRAQARMLLLDALHLLASDQIEPQSEEEEA